MLKKSKFKKIMVTSMMTLIMTGAMNSGLFGMRQIYVHSVTAESGIHQNLRMPVSINIIDEVIERTCKGILDNHVSMDWAAIGLDKAGHGEMINGDYLKNVVEYLKDKDNQDYFKSRPTEYERITLGVLAAKGDAQNVNGSGINLIEKIYNADLESQGINAVVFGLIALDAKDYSVPNNAKWNREELIESILAKQCNDGGWAFFGEKGDPDMTGMAMTALSKYNNDEHPEVKEAIKGAIKYLKQAQHYDGGYESWGTQNSESCAQVIMGLCTNGIDAGKFVKEEGQPSVVEALLEFEVKEDGGFKHINGTDVNGMATEQALYALDEYKLFLKTKNEASKEQICENGNLKTLRPTIYNWTK